MLPFFGSQLQIPHQIIQRNRINLLHSVLFLFMEGNC
uniref:Uncharacterized protein n=1 Tax=Rhizophora mucronata TaxID=61149 RepID=A0A2P2R1G9_RHIMU